MRPATFGSQRSIEGRACQWKHSRQTARVDLTRYLQMDPHLLLGLLNTELRNHCDSLDDLVKTHGLDEARLIEKMAAAGYDYRPEQNQFR